MADPTRAGPDLSLTSIPSLRTTLLDPSIPLFTRYRAMFSLRNISPPTQESIEALAAGFADKSALFRHEIAYVFGQLNSKYSVKALVERLGDDEEVDMVRHECAEALGGIASEGEGEFIRNLLSQVDAVTVMLTFRPFAFVCHPRRLCPPYPPRRIGQHVPPDRRP